MTICKVPSRLSSFHSIQAVVVLLGIFFFGALQAMASDFYIFHTGDDGASEAYLLVIDIGGAGPDINVEFSDSNGNLLQSQHKLLSPYGSVRFRIADYLGSEQGLIHLQSSSSKILGNYWRIFADGVALHLPMSVGFRGETRYFLHRAESSSEAFITLSAIVEDVECELVFYSERGQSTLERRYVTAGKTIQVDVSKYLRGPQGMISLRPVNGTLLCHYYIRQQNIGVKSNCLPLSPQGIKTTELPRLPEARNDSLLIADISGMGTEVQIRSHDESYESPGIKRLLLPHGTIFIKLEEFFSEKQDGLLRITGRSRFLMDYTLEISGRITRISAQEQTAKLRGLSWPVWQPTQIRLRLWNVGEELSNSRILLNQSRPSSPLQWQEILLAPEQLLDWSPEIRADWDSLILRSDTSETLAVCLGLSGSRLLFVSPLHGILN